MNDTAHIIRTTNGDIDGREIERVIAEIEGIAQVAVFGIPHAKFGEAVHAIVVPYAGKKVTAQDVMSACHGRIASNKYPRSVTIRTSPLPKSASGQIQRGELKSQYWHGTRSA